MDELRLEHGSLTERDDGAGVVLADGRMEVELGALSGQARVEDVFVADLLLLHESVALVNLSVVGHSAGELFLDGHEVPLVLQSLLRGRLGVHLLRLLRLQDALIEYARRESLSVQDLDLLLVDEYEEQGLIKEEALVDREAIADVEAVELDFRSSSNVLVVRTKYSPRQSRHIIKPV